jgi:hypothetical protein
MGVARLLSFLAQETAAREASLVPLEPRLGLTDEARVGRRMAIRVGEVSGDAYVDPQCRAGWHMLDVPLHLQDELGALAIRSA